MNEPIDWDKELKEMEEGTKAVPAGNYSFKVTKTELKQARTGSPMIVITAMIDGGPHHGRLLWNNLVFKFDNPCCGATHRRATDGVGCAARGTSHGQAIAGGDCQPAGWCHGYGRSDASGVARRCSDGRQIHLGWITLNRRTPTRRDSIHTLGAGANAATADDCGSTAAADNPAGCGQSVYRTCTYRRFTANSGHGARKI